MTKTDYASVMARKGEIMLSSMGIDYAPFMAHPVTFDYEALMGLVPYDINEVRNIQASAGVGRTALIELRQITRLARSLAPKGKGARIFVKDEAANPSGSYKARRAALSLHHAEQAGFKGGVVTATSGNYGAAVASQAARRNLDCVVVQEVFDSHGIGQPEILEKGRACEIYGAEVMQLSVGA